MFTRYRIAAALIFAALSAARNSRSCAGRFADGTTTTGARHVAVLAPRKGFPHHQLPILELLAHYTLLSLARVDR